MIRPLVIPKCNERCTWFDAPKDSEYGICTYGGYFADELPDWWVKRDGRCIDDDMYERKHEKWN